MRITNAQRQLLSELMHRAFVEIRVLGAFRKSEQAGGSGRRFHNLPTDKWKDDFKLEFFGNAFLL